MGDDRAISKLKPFPYAPCMDGMFTYIYHKFMVNVGIPIPVPWSSWDWGATSSSYLELITWRYPS